MTTKTPQEKSFNKAKIGLMGMQNSVFITSILFSLKFLWDETCPTAYTDGSCIGVNPEFWLKLTTEEQIGLLAHETWHVAFNHMFRSKNFEHKKYNIAADHVINLMLLADGFELPKGGLHDSKYKDMSTEAVYKLLPNPPKRKGGIEYDCDIRKPKKGEADKIQQQVKEILVKAATRAKMQGTKAYGSIPGDILIMLDELVNPKLPWTTILQNYMSSFACEDYSYQRPNRRFSPEFYLPSLHSEALGEICVAVDTSCSVSDEQFKKFLSEINEIKEKLKPLLTTIIDFDTKIHKIHKLGPEDTMEGVGFAGRGGTDLTPVFEYYAKTHPNVLIIFSDLECCEITEDPNYPVIWICVDNPNAHVNFGEIIHFDTRN